MDIKKSFGKRVSELRKKLGYSQESFWSKCKLHRTYIGMIERGEKNVSLENIQKIAESLNISIEFLFKGL